MFDWEDPQIDPPEGDSMKKGGCFKGAATATGAGLLIACVLLAFLVL